MARAAWAAVRTRKKRASLAVRWVRCDPVMLQASPPTHPHASGSTRRLTAANYGSGARCHRRNAARKRGCDQGRRRRASWDAHTSPSPEPDAVDYETAEGLDLGSAVHVEITAAD